MAKTVAQGGDWPVYAQVLQYTAACSDNPDWVYTLIEDPCPPLFKNLLTDLFNWLVKILAAVGMVLCPSARERT